MDAATAISLDLVVYALGAVFAAGCAWGGAVLGVRSEVRRLAREHGELRDDVKALDKTVAVVDSRVQAIERVLISRERGPDIG